MKKNIIIGILIVIILFLCGTIYFVKQDKEKVDSKSQVVNKALEKDNKKESIIDNQDLSINKKEITTDEEFVEYIDEVNTAVDGLVSKEEISAKDENVLKNTFILLTDFIFYDGEIKGKKFSDLTSSCKEKVIDIYEKIDSKIEARFPNYKESIKSTSKKIYTNVKEKSIELKNKIRDEYRDYVGEDGYQQTIDSFNEDKSNVENVYDTYKPYIDSGKEKVKSTYDKAKEKVSNWYKNYKES